MSPSRYDEIVGDGFCYKFQCENCFYQHKFPECYLGRHACWHCWKNGLDGQQHGCYTKTEGLCTTRSLNFEHYRPRGSSVQGFGYIQEEDYGQGDERGRSEGDNYKSLFLEPDKRVMRGLGGKVPQDRVTSGSTMFQKRGNLGTSGSKFVFRPSSTQSGPSKRPHLDEYSQYTEQSFNDRELLIKENTELKGRLELQKERNKNREDKIMQQAEVELRNVRAERDGIKEEVEELRKNTEKVRIESDATKEEVSGLREENDRLRGENDGLRRESEGQRKGYEELQQKFGAAERDIIKYRQLVHNLQGQITSQKQEFQATISKLSRPRSGQPHFINACNPNPNARNFRANNVNQRNGIYPLDTNYYNPFK